LNLFIYSKTGFDDNYALILEKKATNKVKWAQFKAWSKLI
jgi:hypothetical protein